MPPLSVVVTTFNSSATIEELLQSVRWADEIVIIDSFSTDDTLEICREYTNRIEQRPFLGFAKQKQMAINAASHRWVFLLDSDEVMLPELQQEIQQLMQSEPPAAGYTVERWEKFLWRRCHRLVHRHRFLRLLDRERGYVEDIPIHQAPVVDGPVVALKGSILHDGEPSLTVKVAKINDYTSGLAAGRAKKASANVFRLVLYPLLTFLRCYFVKRNCLDGWTGFIGSVCMAFYAFLKYAKAYEHREQTRLKELAATQPRSATPQLDSLRRRAA